MFTLIGICSILIVFAFITKAMPKKRKIILFYMAIAAIILLISDRFAYAYNGATTTVGAYIVRVSKFLAYAMYPIIILTFNHYIEDLLLTEGGLEEVPRTLSVAKSILIMDIVTLFISQPTNIYYFYDENNIYHRTPGHVFSYIFSMAAVLIQFLVIAEYRDRLRKRLLVPLLLFTIMPVLAAILQFFVIHGVSLTGIFIVGMIVLLYCFSIFDANSLIETAHKKEIENLLEKQRNTSLMINQTISALVGAIDAKDSYTNGHSKRVADYSKLIAEKAGKSEKECEKIYHIALLHDIGKIGIPDGIINKPDKLTDKEYAVVKTHPKIGGEILSKITISPELALGAKFHHERYDGKGYPFGLEGEDIPEIARIIAVADTYDAMASKRSYRNVLPREVIRSEFKKGIGTQFDPKFAQIMLSLIDSNAI